MIFTYMYTQVVCFAQKVESSTNRHDHVFSWVLSATPDSLLGHLLLGFVLEAKCYEMNEVNYLNQENKCGTSSFY